MILFYRITSNPIKNI